MTENLNLKNYCLGTKINCSDYIDYNENVIIRVQNYT